MRRLILIVSLAACAAISVSANVQGAPLQPRRYQRDTYNHYLIKRYADGTVRTERVYPGYRNGFPPPAFLYYGYPRAENSYGIGL